MEKDKLKMTLCRRNGLRSEIFYHLVTRTVTSVSCGSRLLLQKLSRKKKEKGGKVIQGDL